MRKVFIVISILFALNSFAKGSQNSHPIYFDGGEVQTHQSVSIDLPYQQMSPEVFYDVSCTINSNITDSQPILFVNIVGDQLTNTPYYVTFNNNNGFSLPFQDKAIAPNNTLVVHNLKFSCADCLSSHPIQMKVYNFDDDAAITFSNCYTIVSNPNA